MIKNESPRPSSKINFKALLLVFIVFSLVELFMRNLRTSDISYRQFKSFLEQNQIQSVVISGDVLRGDFKTPQDGRQQFQTVMVESKITEDLDKHGIDYRKEADSPFLNLIFSFFIPFLVFYGLWYFISRKAMGKGMNLSTGFMSIGKSKAKIYVETETKVTFKDVAGADEALEELKEIIDFLKHPAKFKTIGGKMPKGVLLVGPPGTGKTLIAKAVAGEANVPFFSTNGAEFVEMFVGVGAARVRDLFEQAKASAPCIIFIDELDALGKVRHLSPISGNDEKEQTLNQLLVEMDGFDTKAGIIILAATNRPEIIDPALLRAGRFDRQVLIDKPDKQGRTDILRIHVNKVRLSPEVKLEEVAALTPGFSGADLANLINESALIATRENADSITMTHVTNALERMLTGLQKKNRLLNTFERKVVAHHEMGHALAGNFFNQQEVIHKVSIIPRGIGSLGYTIRRPLEDRFLMTKSELEEKMTVLLAGRAAETLVFSHLSTGAADDLVKATDIARDMVMKYGMTSEMGFVSYEDSPNLSLQGMEKKRGYSDRTAEEIDAHVKHLVMEAFRRAYDFLEENKSLLESSAEILLKKETLVESDLSSIFDSIKPLKNKDHAIRTEFHKYFYS